MEVGHYMSEDTMTIKLVGQIAGAEEQPFVDECEKIMHSEYKKIVLDLTNVPSMNSSSIGKLMRLQKNLTSDRRYFMIKGIHENLYKAFSAIHIDKLIKIRK